MRAMPATAAEQAPDGDQRVGDVGIAREEGEGEHTADQHRGGQALAGDERAGRDEAPEGGQAERHADHHQRDADEHRTGPEAGEQERGPGRHHDGVEQVRLPRGLLRGRDAGDAGEGQQTDHPAERQQAEEHPAPAERGADDPGQRGPGDRWDDPGARDQGEHRGPLLVGVAPPDAYVGDGGHRPGAEALQGPPEDEHEHRRRQATDHEPDGEHHQPRGERHRGAHAVGGGSCHHDADEVPEEEGAEHPAVEPEVAEVLLDQGHHRADRQRLERHQGDDHHEAAREHPSTG